VIGQSDPPGALHNFGSRRCARATFEVDLFVARNNSSL
jgi:hypothetical protein